MRGNCLAQRTQQSPSTADPRFEGKERLRVKPSPRPLGSQKTPPGKVGVEAEKTGPS